MDIEDKLILLAGGLLLAFKAVEGPINKRLETDRAKREADEQSAKLAAHEAALEAEKLKRRAIFDEKKRQDEQLAQELLKQKAVQAETDAQLQVNKTREVRRKAELGIANFEKRWANRLAGMVLIDTNIWMEPMFQPFCKELQILLPIYGHKLKLPKVVIKEMEKLKKEGDSVTRKKAVAGLSHIEQLQKLFIVDYVETSESTYADDSFISLIQNQSLGVRKITLISDDAELRRRVWSEGAEHFAGEILVFEGKEMVREVEVRDRYKRALNLCNDSA